MEEEKGAGKYLAEFDEISKGLANGEVGFFFGAGMSQGSGIHLGPELAKRMLRSAVYGVTRVEKESKIDDLATKYPFEAIAEFCRRKNNYQDLSEWLLEQGGIRKAEPIGAHKELHKLYDYLWPRFPSVLFTTNFDRLIEMELGDNKAVTVTTENLYDLRVAKKENKVAVVHLHGCVSYPKSLVAGEINQATLQGPLFDLLRAELAKDVFIFVGYSLSDTNLRQLFFDIQRISQTRYGLNKKTYIVSPAEGKLDDAGSEATIAREIWRLRGATHLALTAYDFFKSLRTATQNFLHYKAKAEVAERLVGGSIETLDSLLEGIAEKYSELEAKDLLLYLYYALFPKK